MTTRTKRKRDVEKDYPTKQFVAKLRRLADTLEAGGRFRIQVAGERVSIPADAVINIEHERSGDEEEIEFQLKWTND
ncbi:MAG: amphi-Trp domain-containing protein [Planctomycetota bacterium]|jgi:amphi-Trp domain-containing protein